MFNRILVANRGEIARRIFAACREMEIESVAVYSEADAGADWLNGADVTVALNGTTAAESYLDQEQILAAAKTVSAEAIHPGYGFLSENADFAAHCAAHDIIFIGPSPESMRLMGSKANAREVAQTAGVPVTPGVDGANKTDTELAAAASEIGYPVLIKASAGGGGKGMRVVKSAADFSDALQAARSEAANSFGDDHVILEKFFTSIHHIEIQILGDTHGTVLHLFERECSIQRRHQKIIEESPSPTISNETRQQIAQAAVALATQAAYYSAGTVEFMYTEDGNFYLLEMNTRLQVEHPITELVTGIDLAQWQIRIAAGERLSISQTDIAQRGHAIECRLYAEDPANNFLPSIGKILYCDFPTMPNVRIDSGVTSGSEVSPYYDPMLAKIIVWGRNRAEAIGRMRAALQATTVVGVTTNREYMLDILAEENFIAGQTTTHYLDAHFAGWQPQVAIDDELLLAIAAFELLGSAKAQTANRESGLAETPDVWHLQTNWRNVA